MKLRITMELIEEGNDPQMFGVVDVENDNSGTMEVANYNVTMHSITGERKTRIEGFNRQLNNAWGLAETALNTLKNPMP